MEITQKFAVDLYLDLIHNGFDVDHLPVLCGDDMDLSGAIHIFLEGTAKQRTSEDIKALQSSFNTMIDCIGPVRPQGKSNRDYAVKALRDSIEGAAELSNLDFAGCIAGRHFEMPKKVNINQLDC